ncbi:CobW family GTP-binding protein [Leucothrix arctica]|uniref:Cobalamin biosynthesis protein CobW n=1 Tax=Leucothrix arctica TaxID=1481894 RepID=A0A317C6Z7_9GAMM|nr:CobW family GTP-binding protein [Leucothrix arctica]PWQ93193.1 cobalamin biosynthesis protein CobW [Leucothrix arctica]
MNAKRLDIKAVPTNIITGFLGVGKTSTILQLLKNKPESERWAVLVNEFGEIGVDGSLLQGQQINDSGIFVTEVPGGCMCCAAGLPMQIALNQLLMNAMPDRLLIEPTGLGHPKEIMQVLSTKHYEEVLSLQQTLTLVDARNLSDERYTSHETFNQQIAIADTVIGNKADLYTDADKANLIEYVKQHAAPHTDVIFASHGDIDLSVLSGKATASVDEHGHHHHHGHEDKPLVSDMPMPEVGFLKAENQGEGFKSVGWRFAKEKVFDYQKLAEFLKAVDAERVKGAFITNEGLVGFNITRDAQTEMALKSCEESRVEIIGEGLDDSLEAGLMACLDDNS